MDIFFAECESEIEKDEKKEEIESTVKSFLLKNIFNYLINQYFIFLIK